LRGEVRIANGAAAGGEKVERKKVKRKKEKEGEGRGIQGIESRRIN
jgi:hypothetical protein